MIVRSVGDINERSKEKLLSSLISNSIEKQFVSQEMFESFVQRTTTRNIFVAINRKHN